MTSRTLASPLRIIADDLTGATDVADALVRTGRRPIVSVGCEPSRAVMRRWDDCDARIVALKTRSTPPKFAVEESLRALDHLGPQEDTQVIFKVCSTFDSTKYGNIGPVADALVDELEVDLAIVCPVTPANGRTMFMGHLFVGERLLQESSMASHPLTPMHDSDIVRLLRQQTCHRIGLISLPTVREGCLAIREAQSRLRREGCRFAVVDAVTEDDLREIATAAADVRLWVSGSGLPGAISRVSSRPAARVGPSRHGRAVVIAGSCSDATRSQLEQISQSVPSVEVDARRVGDPGYVDELCRSVLMHLRRAPVLAVSTCGVAARDAFPGDGVPRQVAEQVEGAMGKVARAVVAAGVSRLVVAGGETSGAVLAALGIRGLAIGPTIAAGVPWTIAIDPPGLWLALKSGNFGNSNFFLKSLGMDRV